MSLSGHPACPGHDAKQAACACHLDHAQQAADVGSASLCRVPVANVSAKIGDSWIPLQRGTNNQWAYYNSAGPWEDNFPMGVRVTSVTGETIDDAVPSKTGGDGGAQFAEVRPCFAAGCALNSALANCMLQRSSTHALHADLVPVACVGLNTQCSTALCLHAPADMSISGEKTPLA